MKLRMRLLAIAAVLAVALAPVRAIGAEDGAVDEPAAPYELEAADTEALDAMFDLVPEQSCLSVKVDGVDLYGRTADLPVVPASTLKVLTGHIALQLLGPEYRFRTEIVGAPPVDGVIEGDVALVGGGDPLLATDAIIERRELEDLHPTRLDALADAIVDVGIRRITGRVLGDESRYDTARSVPSWPERFIEQEQAGPLSALSVDDGYVWEIEPDSSKRHRSGQPARSAAAALTRLLRDRGVEVDGDPDAGSIADGEVIAGINSAPLEDVVDEFLLASDNQTGELLVKELGVHTGRGGSTEAGVGVLRETMAALGLAGEGSVVVDGSGLDPENRLTCNQLVDVLDAAGGPESRIAHGLPIAAETGTLKDRFRDTAAAGRLRAKTGRLNGVSALAGFVPLASGETATFAFVINDHDDEEKAHDTQTLFATIVTAMDLPCDELDAPIIVPDSIAIASVGTLSMVPLQTVTAPGLLLPIALIEDQYPALVDSCVGASEQFDVVLVP